MAERRATNKYYPPNWDPSKGSINKFRGQHPLRDRARKLDQGILIVRFELPFNVWCEGCNQHIAKGVRFNAEKKQAGNYFSTKIWNFDMKCAKCQNKISIQTDPKNSDYVIVAGAQRKTETWSAEDSGTIEFKSEEEAKKLEDPFYKLEHAKEDKEKAEEIAPVLDKLIEFNEDRSDNFAMSQLLRKSFRDNKKELQKQHQAATALGLGEDVRLLPFTHLDNDYASAVKFKSQSATVESKLKRKLEVKSSSIFSSPKTKEEDKKKTLKLQLLAQQLASKKPRMDIFDSKPKVNTIKPIVSVQPSKTPV